MSNNNIKIYLEDINQIKEKYNPNILSSSISDYILRTCKGIPLKNNLTITIITNKQVNKALEEEITKLIKKHYQDHINELNITAQYDAIKKSILTIIGIISILFSNILSSITKILLPELFLIAGWVAIWEVVYSILFVGSKNKILKKRYQKLLKSPISFITTKE